MIELVQEQAEGVLTQLREIAQIHADGSNGLLVVLEDNIEKYPGQDILKGTVTGEPLPALEVNQLAKSIDNRYDALYEATGEAPELEAIIETLKSGQNAILATDHSELLDIAEQLLAMSGHIRQRGVEFKTGLIASKMIDFLGTPMMGGIVPTRDILSIGFDRAYLTIPNTISTKGRIGRTAMERYNGAVVNALESDMNRRPRSNRVPMLLGVAMPGTINKQLDTAKYRGSLAKELPEKTIVVGQVSYGVINFMKHGLAYATTTKMTATEADVRIDPIHINIRTPEDVERYAAKLIRLLNARDTDVNYIYDRSGNLPVLAPTR